MDGLVFQVVMGAGGFKIVDGDGVIFGSAMDQDEADIHCARLNRKVVPLIAAADHLGSCARITCPLCKTCRKVVDQTRAVRS